MNLKSVIFFILCIFPLLSIGGTSGLSKHTAVCHHISQNTQCKLNTNGNINFGKTRGKFNAKNIFITMSPTTGGELRLYRKDNAQDEIGGEFLLDNFSKKTTYFQYHVIFKDKQGKVAQTKGDIQLLPGKRQKTLFSTIRLREQDIKNITTYQIKMILSDKENKPHQ